MTLQYELLTEPIFGQIIAVVELLAGILFIIGGVRMSRRTAPSSWQETQWLRQIVRMAPGEDPHVYDADDLQAVWRQWLRQLGKASIGTGIGIFIGGCVSFALAQVALLAPFSLPEQLFWFCLLPPMWGITLGFTCGSLVAGQHRATARRGGAAIAAASVPRKVLDYRSPLLTVIIAIPAIVYTVLTILVAPSYSAFDPFDVRMYLAVHGHAIISPPRWILAIFPGAMWLTVLLVESCVWARVKAPARITLYNAPLARDASMALTGLNVTSIYGPMMATPAVMGLGGMLFLSRAADALDLSALVKVTGITTMLVGYIGMAVVLTSEGRLGGRVTGWPWTKERARRAVSAEG